MAENDAVTTVYVSGGGLSREWISALSRGLVAERYAATATIFERPHPDNGVDVMARLHTRPEHIQEIRSRASLLAEVRAYPLECADDYRAWVLAETFRVIE